LQVGLRHIGIQRTTAVEVSARVRRERLVEFFKLL
jgi:hypothetical protein